MKNWKRSIKFWWQRRTRGWDDSETWSLDASLAKLIIPRLKRFREVTIAYPHELTFKEWQSILDKMIDSFEWFASDARFDYKPGEYEKAQEGVELFAKYYGGLWW